MNNPLIRLAVVTVITGSVGCGTAPIGSGGPVSDSAAIRKDIAVLASDSLQGRFTGSPGARAAARYLAGRLQAIGVKRPPCVAAATGPACPTGYIDAFESGSVAAAHAGVPLPLVVENVVGLIPGTDPALQREFIVIGAHYDHLGTSGVGVLDLDSAKAVHNGADDNASGTAAVLALARRLAKNPVRRPVLVALFGGEELGLLGSQQVAAGRFTPPEQVVAMLNFDMVGRLRNDRLIIYGTATAAELPAIVDSANVDPKLTLLATGDGFGSSDHASFYARGIPSLHFFTDIHPEYHRATDDIELIDAGGIARVVGLAERIARRIANRPSRLTLRPPTTVATGGSRRGSNVSLGSIPDMGATGVNGVRLSGVVPGSVAEKAGLKAGDVLVEFDGKPVKDLYEYSEALYSKQPGDTVSIVYVRGAERATVTVVLARRGGGD